MSCHSNRADVWESALALRAVAAGSEAGSGALFPEQVTRAGSRARVLGIDDECRLLIEYEDGSSEALSSGEVSVLLTL